MKRFLKMIIENRDTFAICFFLFGSPVIYYLRDGIGLAPNNMIFTVALLFGPLIMVMPFRNLHTFYNPNQALYLVSFLFFTIILYSLYFENVLVKSRKYYELGVIILIMYIYVIMTIMSRASLNRYFLQFTVILCIIGCLLLVYYVYTNPLYVFGQRATINFSKEGEEFSGNPHIFSKVAYFGIVAGAILFKTTEKKYLRFFLVGCMIIFFFVLVLTQTMLAYLATFIFMLIFFYYNITFKDVYKTSVFLLGKWYVWVVFLFLVYKGVTIFQQQQEIVDTAISYFENRFAGIFDSIFADESKVNHFVNTGDESANTRVHLVKVVFENWVKNLDKGKYIELLFGNGYKHLYIDVPWIEALDSFGILGFLVYSMLSVYMIYVSFKEVKNPRSPFTEFVAYGFIYFMVLNLTGGLLVDYARWGYYALVCRFIPIPAKKRASGSDQVAVKG